MAKKIMQLDVYSDGSMQVLDAMQTEASGRSIEAEQTTWKRFHNYLKKNDEKDSVAEEQFTVIATEDTIWVKSKEAWHVAGSMGKETETDDRLSQYVGEEGQIKSDAGE